MTNQNIYIFEQIQEAIIRIVLFLKMITEFNNQLNGNRRSTYLRDKKKQFITDIIFIKQHDAIIKDKLNLSYIEYIAYNLKDLTQTLKDQLLVFDFCAEQQNPELYFELDYNSSPIQIAKYNNRKIKYYTFLESGSTIYSNNKWDSILYRYHL